MVWNKAWGIDDNMRHSTKALFDRNDMLVKTIGKSQYLTWWRIADKWPTHQKMCETMVRFFANRAKLRMMTLDSKAPNSVMWYAKSVN